MNADEKWRKYMKFQIEELAALPAKGMGLLADAVVESDSGDVTGMRVLIYLREKAGLSVPPELEAVRPETQDKGAMLRANEIASLAPDYRDSFD